MKRSAPNTLSEQTSKPNAKKVPSWRTSKRYFIFGTIMDDVEGYFFIPTTKEGHLLVDIMLASNVRLAGVAASLLSDALTTDKAEYDDSILEMFHEFKSHGITPESELGIYESWDPQGSLSGIPIHALCDW